MIWLIVAASGCLLGLFLIWSFCRAAGLADDAMEDLP